MPIIPYAYVYLAGSLCFVPVWLLLYFRLPRYRRKMIVFGLSYMCLGLAAEYFFWTRDWWHPMTLTRTRIGIEDVIMCFTHVGIPLFLYYYVFGMDLERGRGLDFYSSFSRLATFLSFLFVPILVLFYKFHFHSFSSTLAGFAISGTYILVQRRDLLWASIHNAWLMIAITAPIYFLGFVFSPGAVQRIWEAQMSKMIFLGYPLEDMIWYLGLGFLFGGLYPYVSGRKIKKAESNFLRRDFSRFLSFISNQREG